MFSGDGKLNNKRHLREIGLGVSASAALMAPRPGDAPL